jgi:hypothetical protein
MKADLNYYTTFYKTKHQGHKLDWDHSLGTVTLKARFAAGPKDLTVGLYQAIVLLLFNEETEIGYKQILEATRMGKWYPRTTIPPVTDTRHNRRRRPNKDAAEPCVCEQEGAEEASCGKRSERRRRVLL